MKTVLITGANKSIGFEIARQMAKKGYHVFLGSRDKQRGEAAVAQLKAEGLTAVTQVEIDVTSKASVHKAMQQVAQAVSSLDALINNAGVLGAMPQSAVNVDTDNIRQVYETNVLGVVETTLAFLPLLKEAPEPRIVNVTSGLGSLTLHSDPSWPYYHYKAYAYVSSKAALNAYTITLAYELRDTAFKVNSVDPGYTATDFNKHNGPGTVESAAAIMVKYATLDADGPTGKYFSNELPDNVESPW